mgnify:CR=1 FL=1
MADMTQITPRSALDQPASFKRRGLLFVLSSPSGAGKSTISRKLLADDPGLNMSVSATTRPPRPGEGDGKDYHFVDLERFREMTAASQFLEWAHVFDHRYGTPRAPVETMLERVFILPPSMTELERRLRGRRTDSDEVIERRMTRAHGEISHWDGYDYVLVNDDADACFAKVRTILHAERLKRSRQTGLIGFIRKLERED